MKKKILCFLLVLLLLTGSALADPLTDLTERLNGFRTDDIQVTASLQYIVHQPYSTERLAPLNKLLKYLSIDAEMTEEGSTVTLLADGTPALNWIRMEDHGRSLEWIDSVPRNIYVGTSENDLLNVAGILPEEEVIIPDQNSGGYLLLDEIRNCILRIPEVFPEQCRSEKIRTKIRDYGTATEKVTCTLNKEMVDDGSYSVSVIAASESEALNDLLKPFSFVGKQKVILYRDENGNIFKFVYAGNIRYPEGKVHSLNLDWKMSDSDGILRDLIVLKSPAVNGNDHDNMNIERTVTVTEEKERIEMTWKCTAVSGKEKKVMEGNADLESSTAGNRTYYGVIEGYIRKNNDVKKGWILKPELEFTADQVAGKVEISQSVDGNIPESFILDLNLKPSEHCPRIPDDCVEVMIPESPEEKDQLIDFLTEKTTVRLIRPLLNLPDEALEYFSLGLTEDQWNQVTDAVIH